MTIYIYDAKVVFFSFPITITLIFFILALPKKKTPTFCSQFANREQLLAIVISTRRLAKPKSFPTNWAMSRMESIWLMALTWGRVWW